MSKKISLQKLFPVLQLSVIIVVTTLLYWQANHFEFVLDDSIVISENTFVKKGIQGISEILSNDSMTGYFGNQPQLLEGGRYRPLSLVVFAFGYKFFQLNPFGYHLMNLFLYLLAGVLLYLTIKQLFKENKKQIPEWIIGISVLLFMVHPVHTEVVCNIKSADEILSLLFGLLAWFISLKYSNKQSFSSLLVIWVCLYLSFMAKESSLPLIVAIPLSLIYFRNYSIKGSLIFTLKILLPVFLYIVTRYQALGYLLSSDVSSSSIMNNPYINAGFFQKYSTILVTLLFYLKLLFVPYPLTHDYYPWQIPLQSPASPWLWIAILVIALLLFLAIKYWNKKGPWAYSILFFFITISIVSNVFINVGTLMNERFLFIPSVSFSIFMVWLVWKFFQSELLLKKILTASVLSLTVLGFLWISIQRIPDWESTMSINQSAARVSSNSARANLFYGVAIFNEIMKLEDDSARSEMIREAVKYNDRALQIHPEYAYALRMKAGYAAELYKTDRNLPDLLSEFEKVMSVRPVPFVEEYVDYLIPRSDKSLLVPFIYRIGYKYLGREQNNFNEALNYLSKGYNLDSQDPNILFALCVISTQLGENNDAVRYGEEFLNTHGRNAQVLYYTGNALLQINMKEKGNEYLKEAYQLNPDLRGGTIK